MEFPDLLVQVFIPVELPDEDVPEILIYLFILCIVNYITLLIYAIFPFVFLKTSGTYSSVG